MLTYKELREKPKAFLAATGLKEDEFERLLPTFREKLAAQNPPDKTKAGKPRQRRAGAGPKSVLETDEDKLLFILVYEKTYPLQTMQGLQFGMSQPQANYWIHALMPVLQQTLAEMRMAPERDAEKVAENPMANETAPEFVVDGTERRRQRPKDKERQKEHYSGKEKAHTDKNVLLAHQHTKKVVYLSPTEVGKKNDKKVMDENIISYPAGATLGKDTGFQGYEPSGVLTYQPKKNRKDRS
jgi:hypothetical protein